MATPIITAPGAAAGSSSPCACRPHKLPDRCGTLQLVRRIDALAGLLQASRCCVIGDQQARNGVLELIGGGATLAGRHRWRFPDAGRCRVGGRCSMRRRLAMRGCRTMRGCTKS